MTEQPSPDRFQSGSAADTSESRPRPLSWSQYSDAATSDWYQLLSREPEESEVQEFLELHPAMIPGGSGDVGPGGHHGSDMGAVFRRPTLTGEGRSFEPDFMWVTRSSALITPILIEIEKPTKRWFGKSGRPTHAFTEAHDQLNDWRAWFALDSNRELFRKRFMILGDLYLNRPLEPQFVLIYGRQSEFEYGVGGHTNPDELRRKRDLQRAKDETFMTFDSVRPRFDHSDSLTLSMRSTGPELFAFSPVFGTGPSVADGAHMLGDPTEALARSVMMTDERKAYLAGRWAFWQAEGERQRQDSQHMYTRSLGRE